MLQMSSSPLDLSTVSLFCAPHGILWLTPFFGHIFVTFLVWSAVVGSTECRNLLVGIVIRWTNRCLSPSKLFGTPMCFPCVWMFDSHFFASPHCDGRWRWNCGCISQGLHSKKHMQLTFCVGILLWNLGYLMPGLRTTGCWHIGIVMLE